MSWENISATTEAEIQERTRRLETQNKVAQVVNNRPLPGPELEVINGEDIVPEKIEWLWPSHLAMGTINLVAGDPGLGKSRMAYDLAARVTVGKDWPDGAYGGKPGQVVVLTAEDGLANTAQPVMVASGADMKQVKFVKSTMREGQSGFQFLLDGDLPKLERLIEKMGNVKLVVIDPISAYMGKTDDHKNTETRGVLAPVHSLAEKYKLNVTGVHHLNKSPNPSVIYRICGSIAYIAACRTCWALVLDPADTKEERKLFLCAKTNICRKAPGLAFTVNDSGSVVWESGPVLMTATEAFGPGKPGKRKRENLEKWFKTTLQGKTLPGVEVVEAAKAAGFGEDMIKEVSKSLCDKQKEHGKQDGRSMWTLFGDF